MENLKTKYTVWVGGVELNDFYLSKAKAIELCNEYLDNGYTDVAIEPIHTLGD
jgi:hypothetical protein